MGSSTAAVGAALGAVLLWTTNAVAASVALDQLTVAQLLAVQYASAACAVAVWRATAAVCGRASTPGVASARVGMVALVTGVVGLTGTIFLQFWAFATAPIVGANVIAYGWPLLAASWAAATVRSSHAVAGAGLAALGFLGVVTIFTGHDDAAGGVEVGYLLALGSAACMAFYTVAAGRTDASVTDLLLPATTAGAVLAVAATLVQGVPWPPVEEWWPAMYAGVGPMAAGYGLWTYAMAGRRADQLAPIGYATPLLSTLLLLATGQPATARTLLGAALILACSAGVLVNERLSQRGRGSGPS